MKGRVYHWGSRPGRDPGRGPPAWPLHCEDGRRPQVDSGTASGCSVFLFFAQENAERRPF